jgi:tripartite-type tricarboxylate transporter receptor subunit TctC
MSKILSALFITAIVLAGAPSQLFAQTYPNHPINLIIPMAPGDAVDLAGRVMAEGLTTLLKVPVTPLNKPGAGGVVGTGLAAKSKNDGYTILITNSASIITAKILHPEDVNYDPFKDLTPLGLTSVTPTLITAKKDPPYKSLKDLVEYSKKNPGKIRCGTPGVGTLADFNVPIITNLTGADITVVPFKGASPAITALIGGHVEIAASAVTLVIDHLRSGEARGLVISKKLPEFPAIPTLKELGYQQDLLGVWFAFFAPAGMPAEAKKTLVTALEKVVKDPATISKMAKMGLVQEFVPPDQLFKDMTEEYKVSREIARSAGLVK